MKAVITTRYGAPEVLEIQEVPKPVPKEHQVLIKLHASTVTAGDCELRSYSLPLLFGIPLRPFFGLFKPRIKILGQEVAGEIEAVGNDVTKFKPGDKVFGPTNFMMGGYAQFVCMSEKAMLTVKPDHITYQEAATIPVGWLNALHFLRKANIKRGEKVLINGAGGSIGTMGVQLAKYYGAHVTAVDSLQKLEMLKSIGADEVMDYATDDFTQNLNEYDVILEVPGKAPFWRSIRSLKPNGKFLATNPSLTSLFGGILVKLVGSKRVINGLASEETADLDMCVKLMKEGEIKSIIDREYPLDKIVEAHNYVDQGHKKGCLVISISHED